MAPQPHDHDGSTPGHDRAQGLGLAAAGLGRRVGGLRALRGGHGRWPWWRPALPTLATPRRRAAVALGVLVSAAVIVGFVAASPPARPRTTAAAPAAPADSPPGAVTGEPSVGGDALGGEGSGGDAPDQGAGSGAGQPTTPTPPAGQDGGSPAPTREGEAPAAPPGSPDPDALDYTFPVSPARAASYGRTHHNYPATDIFAPCGTRFVSPVDGVVLEITRSDHWDPGTDTGDTRGGLSVTVLGADGVRYYGSHLATIATGLAVEDGVAAGQTLGTVGHTGSARGIACHLHFGISPPCGIGDWAVRRGVLYPWPYLDAWRRGQRTSPADAVYRWRDAHESICPMSG